MHDPDLSSKALLEKIHEGERAQIQARRKLQKAEESITKREQYLAWLTELYERRHAGPQVVAGTLCGPSVEQVNAALLEGSLTLTQSGLPVVEQRQRRGAPAAGQGQTPPWFEVRAREARAQMEADAASSRAAQARIEGAPLQVGERVVHPDPLSGLVGVVVSVREATGNLERCVSVRWDGRETVGVFQWRESRLTRAVTLARDERMVVGVDLGRPGGDQTVAVMGHVDAVGRFVLDEVGRQSAPEIPAWIWTWPWPVDLPELSCGECRHSIRFEGGGLTAGENSLRIGL